MKVITVNSWSPDLGWRCISESMKKRLSLRDIIKHIFSTHRVKFGASSRKNEVTGYNVLMGNLYGAPCTVYFIQCSVSNALI